MSSQGTQRDESDTVSQLADRLRRARRSGQCHLGVFSLDESTQEIPWPELADRVLLGSGFMAPPGDWQELLPSDARSHVFRIVARDLTHGHPVADEPLVRPLVEDFFALFEPQAIFFCNTAQPWGQGVWTRLTSARYDTGLVAIDGKRAGLIWIEE